MLEPLALVERCLHPEVRGARQNAFCERQDALYIEFIELAGVTVHPGARELLAQFLGVAVVGLDVDRTLEEERLVQTVQLLPDRFGKARNGKSGCARCCGVVLGRLATGQLANGFRGLLAADMLRRVRS